MSSSHSSPDYQLEDVRIVTATAELKAMFHPLRGTLLGLVLERAATVNELAIAVDRPPSSVAHHVDVLINAGLLKVVRTRKRRAIDERFYGRTRGSSTSDRSSLSSSGTIPNLLVEAATRIDTS